MKQFSRVLAAVDFSEPARGAFEYALALSAHHRADLVVVHAVPPSQPFGVHARARMALGERLRQEAAEAMVELKQRVQSGDPAEIILLYAKSLRPDVIVMGTHQRSGISRFRAGSVAERVAAKAAASVLVVPPRHHAHRIEPFRHVAVAIDFSSSSTSAIKQAIALAGGAADRITLLHVVPRVSAGAPRHLHHYGLAEYQGQLIRGAQRRLHAAAAVQAQTSAAVHTRVLVGHTTTEISHAVDSIGADMLVVGLPRRGVVWRTLFGTTAARVLRAVNIPVLAVPDLAATVVPEESSLQHAA